MKAELHFQCTIYLLWAMPFKMRLIFIVIILFDLSNCALIYFRGIRNPDLLNRTIALNRKQKLIESNVFARINSMSISYSGPIPSDYAIEKFKIAFRNSIYNSEKFAEVYLDAKGIKPKDWEIEINVYSEEYGKLGDYGDGFNYWIVMWPAYYPMPFDYPIQPKKGYVRSEFQVTLRNQKKTFKIMVDKRADYKVFFYGMMRTDVAEEKIHNLYENMMDELTEKIRELDLRERE